MSLSVKGATPHSNKIRLLEQTDILINYSLLFYLDCDIILLSDPYPYLKINSNKNFIQFRSGRTIWNEVAMQQDIWYIYSIYF